MLDTITVMTTGKSGRYIVDGVGVVDFTQTHKNLANFIHNIDFSCGFLPRANIKQAYADLKKSETKSSPGYPGGFGGIDA
ncbi:hypothetical protein ACFOHS_10170 [Jhaorihella thermophila]